MEIPKQVKIGGHVYEIIYPYTFIERDDCNGLHDYGLKKIWVSMQDTAGADRPDSSIFVTFLHEIIHAIEVNAGHFVFRKLGEDEEAAINAFAECVYQILIDNGWLKEKSQ